MNTAETTVLFRDALAELERIADIREREYRAAIETSGMTKQAAHVRTAKLKACIQILKEADQSRNPAVRLLCFARRIKTTI